MNAQETPVTTIAAELSQYGYSAEPITSEVVRKLFRIIMNPITVSADMADLFHSTLERSGLFVSIPYATIDEIRSHAVKLAECLSSVLSSYQETVCYILVSGVSYDNPEREDILLSVYNNLIVRLEQLYNSRRVCKDLLYSSKDEDAMMYVLITFPDRESSVDWDTILTELQGEENSMIKY